MGEGWEVSKGSTNRCSEGGGGSFFILYILALWPRMSKPKKDLRKAPKSLTGRAVGGGHASLRALLTAA
jgi:hypothetical protein